MSPFYDDPSLADDRSPYEGLFDAQLRLPLQPRPLVDTIVKRDGRPEPYDLARIAKAIREAARSVGVAVDTAGSLARAVTLYLSKRQCDRTVTVDQVHEAVERVLTEMNALAVAAAYVQQHDRAAKEPAPSPRASASEVIVEEVESALFADGARWNPCRSDETLGHRAKEHYATARVFSWDIVEAHRTGDIYVHAIDALDRVETARLRAGSLTVARGVTPAELISALSEHAQRAAYLGEFAHRVVTEAPIAALVPHLSACERSWPGAVAAAFAGQLALCGARSTHVVHVREGDALLGEAGIDFCSALFDAAARPRMPRLGVSVEVTPRALTTHANGELLFLAMHHLPALGGLEVRLRQDQAFLPWDLDASDPAPIIGGRVTLNLARAAQKTKHVELLFHELERTLELAHRAHVQRYRLLLRLLDRAGEPLAPEVLRNGLPFLLGVTGLNECVEHLTGDALHETEDAMELAEEILARLRDACGARPVSDAAPMLLAPTNDPATSQRFDALDRMRFSTPKAPPSTLGVDFGDDDLDPIEAAHLQGRFHALFDHGHSCGLLVDTRKQNALELTELVRRVLCETPCDSVTVRALKPPARLRRDA